MCKLLSISRKTYYKYKNNKYLKSKLLKVIKQKYGIKTANIAHVIIILFDALLLNISYVFTISFAENLFISFLISIL